MRTGYVCDPLGLQHHTGVSAGLLPADPVNGLQPYQHYEHPETKTRLANLIDSHGPADLVRLAARPAEQAELQRVHTPEHLTYLQEQSALPYGGDAGDGCSPFGHGSYAIATRAAGSLIVLTEHVVRGDVDNGYALTRPPGHHATADRGMGFCAINNVAVAIAHARATLDVGRVAVVDFDVHHGNGTQSIFYNDPDVLTISIHQEFCFPPDTGALDERGAADGFGAAVNIPLPAGSGPAAYRYAMERVVLPALHRHQPDLIFISAGYDSSVWDPLGRQMLIAESYAELTGMVMEAADTLCGGRVVVAHEGGYNPVYVPFCGLAVVRTLRSGPQAPLAERVLDPHDFIVSSYGSRPMRDDERAVVDAAAHLVDGVPGRAAQPAGAPGAAPAGQPAR